MKDINDKLYGFIKKELSELEANSKSYVSFKISLEKLANSPLSEKDKFIAAYSFINNGEDLKSEILSLIFAKEKKLSSEIENIKNLHLSALNGKIKNYTQNKLTHQLRVQELKDEILREEEEIKRLDVSIEETEQTIKDTTDSISSTVEKIEKELLDEKIEIETYL